MCLFLREILTEDYACVKDRRIGRRVKGNFIELLLC